MNRQNYAEAKDLKKQLMIAAGLVSDRFPKVSSITIKMAYCHKSTDPILIRTVNVLPSGYAYFNMECMVKDCVGGGFNLAPVIKSMINSHKKSAKGKLACKGKSVELPGVHANIAYEVVIEYNKRS